jgi:hypothetical protein
MVSSLSLNLNKTYYVQFKGASAPVCNTTTNHDDKLLQLVKLNKLERPCWAYYSLIEQTLLHKAT